MRNNTGNCLYYNRKTMKARYDFYHNPPSLHNKRKNRLHARVVSGGTTGTNRIAEEIHDKCSLTVSDVNGVLIALRDVLIRRLGQGERIHIEGLGYFQMTLSCPPVRTAREIRAESIRFKSVVFRPEKALKEKLRHTSFERSRVKRHSRSNTEMDIDNRLTRFFTDHDSIVRQQFESLCGFTRTTANRRLKKLVEEGKLKKSGYSRYPYYEPEAGYYK